MNAKDKVVSQPMAEQLALAGWKTWTERSWRQQSGGWVVVYTPPLQALTEARYFSGQFHGYHHYAPDVSELLEALAGHTLEIVIRETGAVVTIPPTPARLYTQVNAPRLPDTLATIDERIACDSVVPPWCSH